MKEIQEFLQDKLFYHNSYLPKKPKDWDIYNQLIIDSILTWLSPRARQKSEREAFKKKIEAYRKDGESLTTIGRRFGTSRQRIHQILKNK